jgi:positive regulator of sigma E activity
MTDRKNYIEHDGLVIKVTPEQVDVQVVVRSACASCEIKGACNLSDIQEKVVEVKNPKQDFKVGEKVIIGMETVMGYKALFLGYLFPFLVILLSLILGLELFHEEGIAAGFALAMAAVYYFIIYFYRKNLQKVFRYKIRKTTEI